MVFGLHVSSSGGVENAPSRARQQNGDTLQIFAGSPRMWRKTIYTPEQGEAYREEIAETGISSSFIHVMYLTSYGTPDDEHRAKSIDAYNNALANCDTIGARGAITHLGSHKGEGFEAALPRIKDSLDQVLNGATQAEVILENSAGAGAIIGSTFEELAAIIAACDYHPRLKICLDTAHVFTAGYDIRTATAWENVMQQFDEVIGLERLSVIHLNDSKVEFNTHKDRHENIGDGYIGSEGFRAIVNDKRLQNIPGILEVPGINGKGPDAENIARLHALMQ